MSGKVRVWKLWALFRRCRERKDISPNAITYTCTLKACGITQDVDMGKIIHDDIVSGGLLKEIVMLGITLVDMYAKCGALHKTKKVSRLRYCLLDSTGCPPRDSFLHGGVH
ncbi:hypothetical protein GOP47_0008997 [Adiantum capillus-veneris]|uniref:Uncharacterized protein n=1 Tax=Adiantum capillus-veneris TaxID=13818 RepID=A0A9D4V0V8_ADICA|nr:hypothetical protein GOP47_0008997 [Adiantum capillus-veneris]